VNVLKNVNLALMFLLELCMLAALGYWGFKLGQGLAVRIVVGLGAPLLAAVVWGMFLAPKASMPLQEPLHLLLELIIFALAIAALYAAGRTSLAFVFGIVYALNVFLRYNWR
jgi:hypothetical protein